MADFGIWFVWWPELKVWFMIGHPNAGFHLTDGDYSLQGGSWLGMLPPSVICLPLIITDRTQAVNG